MSRGLGSVQRRVLDTLSSSTTMMATIDIVGEVFGKTVVSQAEAVSVRRALRKLVATGKIDRFRSVWQDRNHRYGSYDVVDEYRQRCVAAFGKSPS